MNGITGDFSELDAVIARVGGLADATARAVAKAAPKIEAAARANYAAQKGADGTTWATNKNGKLPSLARPAAAVFFKAEGNSLIGVAEDVLRYHQLGNEKLPKRAVFPDEGTLPPEWRAIIDAALRAEIETKP